MPIKGLNPLLPETGKIKIGGKAAKEIKTKSGSTFRPPEKWDHFQITTLDKDANDNYIIDKALTKKVTIATNKDGAPTKIGPCIFIFDEVDLNLFTTYAYYTKTRCFCRGNGEKARRLVDNDTGEMEDVTCDPENCESFKKKLCKPSGILSVLFPQAGVLGGVHKFRTTSWNSISKLSAQLHMFNTLTNGHISGRKFNLVLNSKDAIVKGKKQKVYFVTLEFDGSVEALMAPADGPKRLGNVEQAKQMVLENHDIIDDPEEFSPEYDMDDDGNILDAEGAIVDKVADEPEGAGIFADNKGAAMVRGEYEKYLKAYNSVKNPPDMIELDEEALKDISDADAAHKTLRITKELTKLNELDKKEEDDF
jgi:hypothetical protein